MTEQTQNENSADGGQSRSTELLERFESWWEAHGQYCRAGGGDYEKTFAYRAWEAATAEENEACMKLCLAERRNPFSRDHNNGLQHAADVIRMRSNAELCGLRGFSRRSERALCYAFLSARCLSHAASDEKPAF
jgi:hypothetical protein